MADDKCPRCHSERTHIHHPFSPDNELPRTDQRCSDDLCGLPCRLWGEWGQLAEATTLHDADISLIAQLMTTLAEAEQATAKAVEEERRACEGIARKAVKQMAGDEHDVGYNWACLNVANAIAERRKGTETQENGRK